MLKAVLDEATQATGQGEGEGGERGAGAKEGEEGTKGTGGRREEGEAGRRGGGQEVRVTEVPKEGEDPTGGRKRRQLTTVLTAEVETRHRLASMRGGDTEGGKTECERTHAREGKGRVAFVLQVLTKEGGGGRGGAKVAMWQMLVGRQDVEEVHLLVRAEARQQRRAREWYEKLGFRRAWRWAKRENQPEEDGGKEKNEQYMVATRAEVMTALEGEMVDGGLAVQAADRCRTQGGEWLEMEAVRMLRQHFGRLESRRGRT